MQTINDIVFFNNSVAVICCSHLIVYTIHLPPPTEILCSRQQLSVKIVVIYCEELAQWLFIGYTLFEIEKYFKANLAIWIILLLINVNVFNL